jgi:hypothetical protein
VTHLVRRTSWFLLAVAVALPAVARDEKPDATVAATKTRGNVFSGVENDFQFKVEAAKAVKGRAVWRVAAGAATVKTGEVAIDAAPGAPATVPVKFAVAEFDKPAILPTKLTVTVYADGQAKPVATYEQDLWVFPKDAFADKSEWLKKLKINLYDPTAKGATTKVLEAAKIPFEQLRSVEAVEGVTEGTVVIGEGVSFKEEKGLAAALQKLAAGGRAVLILAPSEGEVIVPGLGGPAGLEDLTFRREIVRKLDKRLDPDGWPPDGKAVASSIKIKSGDDGVTGEVTAGPGGWPWVEAKYGKGRWAVCGLGVIAKWDDGPTPRFFFARLLEYLTDSETEQPKKENE